MKSEVDDWLSELPPLDGADDDAAAEDGTQDDLLPDDDDDASLDDTTADDLDVDDGVDIDDDEPGAGEDDDTWEADVGEPELDLADESDETSPDADTPGVAESDLDLDDDDLPASTDDAGEEGTTDAIEQSIDEELPALDADDEGDFEDALLLETGLAFPTTEGPRWADQPWQRDPAADRALGVAAPDDDAVAAMAMCVAPELLVSVTVAGRLLIDGSSVESPRGRLLPSALVAAKSGPPLIALARMDAAALLWIASRNGHLAASRDLGKSWAPPVDLGKSILALAVRADGRAVAMATHAGAMEILVEGEGARWDAKPVDVEGRAVPADAASSPWLAAQGSSIAFGDPSGVWVSRRGEGFTRVTSLAGTTAGAFFGTAEDAPLVFAETPPDAEESARLLRVSPDGRVQILADVAPPDADDRADPAIVLAMTYDEAGASLRLAFSSVVCTVVPPRSKA